MNSRTTTTDQLSVAASVAPEDIKLGDFVAVLNEIEEFPSFLWSDAPNAEELVRIRLIPAGSGKPLKVKAICLPFLFVRHPSGPYETLDIRRSQLVRLASTYAKPVWKKLEKVNGETRR